MITASEACIIHVPAIVKAKPETSDGRRMVEVEVSCEKVDSEGDVVLQKALLDSADSFIRSGHLDIDHISEIGSRIGVADPTSFIVGRPTEVNDLGDKKTGITGEIMRDHAGRMDTAKNRFDAFWKSLQSDPPVQWSASIYGFPTDIDDCTEKSCKASGATRYVIKAIDWRSTAFTRNPINTSLRGYAKVVAAKSMIEDMQAEIRKGGLNPFGLAEGPMSAAPPVMMACPMNLDHMWGQYQRHKADCPFLKEGNSVLAFRDHYIACCGSPHDMADVLAHAMMYAILRDKRKG